MPGAGYQCSGQGTDYLLLPPTSGIIPSVLTEERNLGSADCPWLIKVQISVTIHQNVHTHDKLYLMASLKELAKLHGMQNVSLLDRMSS